MLSMLDRKIDKNNIVMAQMKEQQLQLQVSLVYCKFVDPNDCTVC